MAATISLGAYLIYYFLYHSQVHYCPPGFGMVSTCNPTYKEPVCALYYGDSCKSKTGFCTKDFVNDCMACSDPSVIATVPGKCKINQFQKCRDQSTVKCNPYYEEYVCAFVQEQGCSSQLFPRTVINSCMACTSDDTLFYTNSKCPEDAPGICRPEQRYPEFCTLEYSPQCTYYRDGNSVWRQTTSNRCGACMGSKAVFYVPGFCEYEEQLNSGI